MKIRRWIFAIISSAAFLALTLSPASATPALYDWAFNINGDLYEGGAVFPGDPSSFSPALVIPGLDGSSFDWATGLGELLMTFSSGDAGDYSFIAFFDHEVVEDLLRGIF